MSTRLTKTDYFVVYVILLMIALFIGGFFLGTYIGKEKAAEEFAEYLPQNQTEKEKKESRAAYSHTDFASYYYNVYIPFSSFRSDYIDFTKKMTGPEGSVDAPAHIKIIQTKMKDTNKELEKAIATSSSPLLQKSYTEYVKSLHALEAAIQTLAKSNLTKEQVDQFFAQNQDIKKGQKHWLQGQNAFYEAITLWESIYITRKAPKIFESVSSFPLNKWNSLNLHQKNELISKVLLEKNIVSDFNPEDVTYYIDSLSTSKADKLSQVGEAIEVLVASTSIIKGTFPQHMDRYKDTTSPMIPIFSK